MKIMNIVLGSALCAATLPFAASAHAEDTEKKMAPPRCDYGAPHPNSPEEFKQFAFLIGDFTISLHRWAGEDWSPPRPGAPARWNGWYGLGGTMVYDEWFNPDPGFDPDAGRGINVRFYDKDESIWKMMWISTNGKTVLDLRAEMQDGKLTMWQVYPEKKMETKADFTIVDADTWYRTSYQTGEDGKLVPQFKLVATRIACPVE